MTDVKNNLQEIKQLTAAYIQHNRNSFFTSMHLKSWILNDIYNNAQTPQQIMNYLHQNHNITPYEQFPRHEVLVMNRTPLWLWLIQAFFIVITFPVSVPALMILSWINRGTINFMRTNGSIYLEKVLNLCRQAGVEAPDQPSSSSFHKRTTALSSERTAHKGASMQKKMFTNQLDTLRGSFQPVSTIPASGSQALLQSTKSSGANDNDTEHELDNGMGGLIDMGRAFTRAIVENPTMIVDVEVLRTNGKAVFFDAKPLKKISPNLWGQKFSYGAAWTKPWQELDVFISEIKIFHEFTFVRRVQKTDKFPTNIIPSTNISGRLYAFGLSLYQSDTKTLLEQAWQNRGSAPTANKLYKKALDEARNNEEYTNAMEALINLHCGSIDWIKNNRTVFFRSEAAQVRYHQEIQSKLRELDEYIDMLPDNFHKCSTSARTLQAYFKDVWNYLADHDLDNAWNIFNKNEISALIETPFVQRCLPHFVCLWYQIKGLFYLKNRYESLYLEEEDVAKKVQYYMNKTLVYLQENNVPEASSFEQGFVKPIQQMQEHVELLFQQIPRELARKYAVQHFRDQKAWALEGRNACFRFERRDKPTSIPSSFVEPYKDIIARIDAGIIEQSYLAI